MRRQGFVDCILGSREVVVLFREWRRFVSVMQDTVVVTYQVSMPIIPGDGL